MSTAKHVNAICIAAAIAAVLLMLLMLNADKLGIRPASSALGYPDKLFDTSTVHTIDVIMDDWDSFIATCENKEYAVCSVVIDGETCPNVGIRAKGNTSLSTVSSLNSDRYSFKLEFDQYADRTYHGLDKLSLNNLIQDNTYMKDYLTYRLMGEFDVAAPLCSFAYVTVNGEDWGLYLAVEGVEDAFLQRNFGRDCGELYKPDSLSMGGRPGNGRDFNMQQPMPPDSGTETSPSTDDAMPNTGAGGGRPGSDSSTLPDTPQDAAPADPAANIPPSFPGSSPDDSNFSPPDAPQDTAPAAPPDTAGNDRAIGRGMNGGGMGGGMGSSDVKLQYVDDSPDSYANIFDSAKTDVTDADRTRLIAALHRLSSGDITTAVDIESTLRYFVVHNFVVNDDSYTGSMVHNYYLYEKDGRLSMIPWDYNLAFGTFRGSSATDAVNDPIDTPLSVSGDGDRPMADWIFNDPEYTALYHTRLTEFLDSVDITAIIDQAEQLISPYVKRDPTAFCTYQEFTTGVAALRDFCQLRTASVRGQLAGTIPCTDDGQAADASTLINADGLDLSDMGTMNHGSGFSNRPDGTAQLPQATPQGFEPPEDITPPADLQPPTTPDTATDRTSTQPDTANPADDPITDNTARPAQNMHGSHPGSMGSTADMTDKRPDNTAGSSPLLLGVSLACLALGLLIACQFKR